MSAEGLYEMLEALFAYRNKMFHNGFEWPASECCRFASRIAEEGWQKWISWASHGDAPWIFYMTDEFIQHCLSCVGHLLEAFGAYAGRRDHNASTPVGER